MINSKFNDFNCRQRILTLKKKSDRQTERPVRGSSPSCIDKKISQPKILQSKLNSLFGGNQNSRIKHLFSCRGIFIITFGLVILGLTPLGSGFDDQYRTNRIRAEIEKHFEKIEAYWEAISMGEREAAPPVFSFSDQDIKSLKKVANKGMPEAQIVLGFAFSQGDGIPQDYEKAVGWYHEAAEQGHPRAQSMLGWMYHEGEMVPRDSEKAVRWLREAAEQGHPVAQSNLGAMYSTGTGVPRDYEQAVRWFHKAAEQGIAVAQANLGFMYVAGRGVSKDAVAAYKWYLLCQAQEEFEEGREGLNFLESILSPEDIAEGRKRAREFLDEEE